MRYGLQTAIGINRKQKLIILPFFFIDVDKSKTFGIQFSFATTNTHYKTIDSISYHIYSDEDSLSFSGSLKDPCFFYNAHILNYHFGKDTINDTLCWAYSGKGYSLNLPFKNEMKLKIIYILYGLADNNQYKKMYIDTCSLEKAKKGIFFFNP